MIACLLNRPRAALLLVALSLLSLCGSAGRAAPAVVTDKPPVLFSAHATFHPKPFTQNGQKFSHADLRSQPLALPAGRYWFFADYHRERDNAQVNTISLRLVRPDGIGLDGATLTAITDGAAGRIMKEVTLTAPFQGTVEYGGGGFGTVSLWLRITPKPLSEFLPFGFGRTPKPLKKGVENAVRGTLTDDIGDFYYLLLPAGTWQVSLVLTTADNTGAADPNRPGSAFGASVELLDEQGVPKVKSSVPGSTTTVSLIGLEFSTPGQDRLEGRETYKADETAYVKLHVAPSAGVLYPKIVPLHYILALEPAPAAPPKP